MQTHFWWLLCILSCVTASEDASRAHLTDPKLNKFFTTRTSLTAYLEDLERTRDEEKMNLYQHRKKIDINQRNSMLAHNIDSRYPNFGTSKERPALIGTNDRAESSGPLLQPVNIEAEIVSPVSPPKKKKTPPPNFSRPLPYVDRYESVTENILREYT